MPRDGSLIPRDLADKGLDVLRVECEKCGRSGRYGVVRLAEQIGWDGKLTDWPSATEYLANRPQKATKEGRTRV